MDKHDTLLHDYTEFSRNGTGTMSSQLKPIKVLGKGGPNPPKVAIMLEELGLPYEAVAIPLSDIKKPEYTAINPNGRLPSIQDPNTGITLWESGSIVEYLIELYDKEQRLSFAPGTPEAFHAKQWLFFQATGQGPYFGQAAWFRKFHPEHIPSALDRYVQEVKRVCGVLEGWLVQQKDEHGGAAKGDGPWLVGNKVSYADLAFIPWQRLIALILTKDEYNDEDYPEMKAWLKKMIGRKAVAQVLNEQGGKIA